MATTVHRPAFPSRPFSYAPWGMAETRWHLALRGALVSSRAQGRAQGTRHKYQAWASARQGGRGCACPKSTGQEQWAGAGHQGSPSCLPRRASAGQCWAGHVQHRQSPGLLASEQGCCSLSCPWKARLRQALPQPHRAQLQPRASHSKQDGGRGPLCAQMGRAGHTYTIQQCGHCHATSALQGSWSADREPAAASSVNLG